MQFEAPFILASASPRRRDLLESIGMSFSVEVSDVDEGGLDASCLPSEVVERLAMEKADAVASSNENALVLGADTVVVLDDCILGKPSGPEDARLMLHRLSGRTNTVYSGVALVHKASGRRCLGYETTDVTFAELTEDEIDRYVASGAPLDKAGSYGIQGDMGALFISGIQGDYFNVVGLPLHRMYRMIQQHFSDLVRI